MQTYERYHVIDPSGNITICYEEAIALQHIATGGNPSNPETPTGVWVVKKVVEVHTFQTVYGIAGGPYPNVPNPIIPTTEQAYTNVHLAYSPNNPPPTDDAI